MIIILNLVLKEAIFLQSKIRQLPVVGSILIKNKLPSLNVKDPLFSLSNVIKNA